jgi:2-hydroxyacyl-CoA lyase 1
MILISGSSDLTQTSRQAFQEVDQVYFVKPYTKYSVRITDAEDIPYHIEKAVRLSMCGRPGPVYLDMPGDVLSQTVNTVVELLPFTQPAISYPDPQEVSKAVYALRTAKKPLIIVGKGAAYGRAEAEVTAFISATGFPFLPTPMGKGVVPDSHELNISPARSMALLESDTILLIGARLNWILHYGLPPRYNKDVRILQIDSYHEEHSNNVRSFARLIGDCKVSISAMLVGMKGFVCKE